LEYRAQYGFIDLSPGARIGGGCLLAVSAALLATFVQLQFPPTGDIARANPYLILPALIAGGICGALIPRNWIVPRANPNP
jgi:hypothetical protein